MTAMRHAQIANRSRARVAALLVVGFLWLASPAHVAAECALTTIHDWPHTGIEALAAGNDGVLTVITFNGGRLERRTLTGGLLDTWYSSNGAPSSCADFFGDVSIGPAGHVYQSDHCRSRVRVFSPSGELSHTIYGLASAPRDIAFGNDGLMYILDAGRHQVVAATLEGEIQHAWGQYGVAPGEFQRLDLGIAIGPSGSVYVADSENHRVQRFSAGGEFELLWGQWGGSPGEFIWPTDIAAGEQGEIYVVDGFTPRLQVFDAEGQLICYWELPGVRWGGHKLPKQVSITSAGEIVIGVLSSRVLVLDAEIVRSKTKAWGLLKAEQ